MFPSSEPPHASAFRLFPRDEQAFIEVAQGDPANPHSCHAVYSIAESLGSFYILNSRPFLPPRCDAGRERGVPPPTPRSKIKPAASSSRQRAFFVPVSRQHQTLGAAAATLTHITADPET
jgi:hypothetical protein